MENPASEKCGFKQFSLNFEKNCQAKVDITWKGKHVKFAGA